MRSGDRIIFGAPETRRVIFPADLRDLAVWTMLSRLHEEMTRPNTLGQLSDSVSNLLAALAGYFVAIE